MLQPSPAVATEYALVQPQPTLIGPMTPEAITAFQRTVTLQGQGEAVQFFDGMPALTTALAFATIYDIADEAVFHISTGELVLLFDHQAKETLRAEEVDEAIWGEILKVKNKGISVQDIAAPAPKITLDLATLWSRVREHNDIITRTKLFIKSLAPILTPAMTIHLHGEIPNLALLSAIYLVRPYGYTITYADAHGGNVTLFSNL